MSAPKINTFTSYSMTEEEELQGALLTVTQKEYMQNQLSLCAEEKIAIDFDPANPMVFAQQEAYKRAQIDTYRYILESSLAAEEIQRDLNNPV